MVYGRHQVEILLCYKLIVFICSKASVETQNLLPTQMKMYTKENWRLLADEKWWTDNYLLIVKGTINGCLKRTVKLCIAFLSGPGPLTYFSMCAHKHKKKINK